MEYDGIIVGGGHNGLVCAAYLAKAGLKVAVVERNESMGGAAPPANSSLPGSSITHIPPTISLARGRSPATCNFICTA